MDALKPNHAQRDNFIPTTEYSPTTQIPDYIPIVSGLWKYGTKYQDYADQVVGARLVKTDRRQRLMACCFANRVTYLSTEPRACREIIEVAIQFADGNATKAELVIACGRGWDLCREALMTASVWAAWAAARSVWASASAEWAARAVSAHVNSGDERIQQSRIYGLYLPIVVEPEWRTSATVSLAESLYLGDSSVAPVLADELEMSGYDGLWIRILRESPEVFYKGMSFIDGLRGIE